MSRWFLVCTWLVWPFLAFAPLQAAPWGKNANLAKWSAANPRCLQNREQGCHTPFLGRVAEIGIAFHQNVISPADGPRSHFLPSSSQYTLDAMRKYGFFLGFIMGCDRLMRENNDPWIYRLTSDASGMPMKSDPVP